MPQLKSSAAHGLPAYLTICCLALIQSLTANGMSSTTTLAATPAAAVYSQPVVLTASVAPASPSTGVAAPTGQVTFQDGGNPIGTAALGTGIATLSLKALAVGVHTITAMYGGDSNWSSSQASTMVTISQAQTMSTVSLLAGYKVLAVVTPVAPATGTPTGSVALLDPRPTVAPLFKGTLVDGSVSFSWPYTSVITNGLLRSPSTAVTVSYAGDANYKASTSAPLLRVTSAAANLGVSFAPDEVVSLFNVTGMTGDSSATLPLPTSLGGVTVKIKDSAGVDRAAPLYGVFASSNQINLVIPADSAPGTASVTVTLPGGSTLATLVTITPTTPSIFAATMNGTGVYAGQIVHVHADGSQTFENSVTLNAATNTFAPTPINFGPSTDQIFLVLYGTGFRHSSADGIVAFLNGMEVPLAFAAQGQYPGLDQVNLQIPRSFAGAGTVNIEVDTTGPGAALIVGNTVTASFP